MSEFQEVMRQIKRICSRYQNCEDAGCILHDVCGSLGYCSANAEQARQIEQRVKKWAAENPEPVYPTWFEWLERQGVAGMIKGEPYYDSKDREIYLNQPAFTPKAFDHIPATIAEKLGIEPKEE